MTHRLVITKEHGELVAQGVKVHAITACHTDSLVEIQRGDRLTICVDDSTVKEVEVRAVCEIRLYVGPEPSALHVVLAPVPGARVAELEVLWTLFDIKPKGFPLETIGEGFSVILWPDQMEAFLEREGHASSEALANYFDLGRPGEFEKGMVTRLLVW